MAKAKKLPSGKWRALVYDCTNSDGKRHYKSFTASTKKEAEYLAAEFALSRKGIGYDDLTLSDAYRRYIDSKADILSPSTIAGYERSKRNHFQELMNYKLTKLNANIIQTAINEMSANHSPKTVRNAHGLLHAVLKAYRPDLEIQTTLPQKIKPEYIIPTTEEVNKLLEVANDIIRIPIMLASQGSLRRSEICALTVDDFTDLGVKINKAAVEDNDGNIVIKTTKTIAGTRFVPLPQSLIAECRKWKHFGLAPKTLTSNYYICRKKADVPKFSFHKLRHYFASELHAQGVPDQYICEIGGWESVEMLHNIYQHTMRDKQKSVSDKIISIFNTNFNNCNTKCNTSSK